MRLVLNQRRGSDGMWVGLSFQYRSPLASFSVFSLSQTSPGVLVVSVPGSKDPEGALFGVRVGAGDPPAPHLLGAPGKCPVWLSMQINTQRPPGPGSGEDCLEDCHRRGVHASPRRALLPTPEGGEGKANGSYSPHRDAFSRFRAAVTLTAI